MGTVGRDSAESVAYLMLSVIPAEYSVAVLFVVSCFVSLSMGTSVGTITLITPYRRGGGGGLGFSLPLCVASVMGGAMFGDNLSFISDTTIAACQGQGCQMKDKFRENFKDRFAGGAGDAGDHSGAVAGHRHLGTVQNDYNLLELIPYLIVFVGGIIGVNVFVVLLLGILSGSIIVVAEGAVAATDLLGNMGTGAAGMFETTMVAVLVSAICALIREYGGFTALLNGIKSLFKSKKGRAARHGPARRRHGYRHRQQHRRHRHRQPHRPDMAETYDISRRKTASILDTFSCVFQGRHPLRRPDARGHLGLHRLGFQVSAFRSCHFCSIRSSF